VSEGLCSVLALVCHTVSRGAAVGVGMGLILGPIPSMEARAAAESEAENETPGDADVSRRSNIRHTVLRHVLHQLHQTLTLSLVKSQKLERSPSVMPSLVAAADARLGVDSFESAASGSRR
jgi:hypothetical protein